MSKYNKAQRENKSIASIINLFVKLAVQHTWERGKDYLIQKPNGVMIFDGIEFTQDELESLNNWQDLLDKMNVAKGVKLKDDQGQPKPLTESEKAINQANKSIIGRLVQDYGGKPRFVYDWMTQNSVPFVDRVDDEQPTNTKQDYKFDMDIYQQNLIAPGKAVKQFDFPMGDAHVMVKFEAGPGYSHPDKILSSFMDYESFHVSIEIFPSNIDAKKYLADKNIPHLDMLRIHPVDALTGIWSSPQEALDIITALNNWGDYPTYKPGKGNLLYPDSKDLTHYAPPWKKP